NGATQRNSPTTSLETFSISPRASPWRSVLASTNPQWPADPELSGEEKKQYDFLIGNNRWGEAFVVQQSFLLRKRLNLLNEVTNKLLASSKKVETASIILVASTILLLVFTIVTWFRHP